MDKLVISVGVLPSATVNLLQCFSPLLQEALLHYIVLISTIPPSTCLLSSFVLEFLTPSHSFLIFWE